MGVSLLVVCSFGRWRERDLCFFGSLSPADGGLKMLAHMGRAEVADGWMPRTVVFLVDQLNPVIPLVRSASVTNCQPGEADETDSANVIQILDPNLSSLGRYIK